jgi:hypothetical protein
MSTLLAYAFFLLYTRLHKENHYVHSGGASGGSGGGGLPHPYHPGSHGNPSKLPIEILRMKEEEKEGGRNKKRNESILYHTTRDSLLNIYM